MNRKERQRLRLQTSRKRSATGQLIVQPPPDAKSWFSGKALNIVQQIVKYSRSTSLSTNYHILFDGQWVFLVKFDIHDASKMKATLLDLNDKGVGRLAGSLLERASGLFVYEKDTIATGEWCLLLTTGCMAVLRKLGWFARSFITLIIDGESL
ncbi:hypothetical protein B0T21DRAFT_452377 [Apiosordaria backusii]|uniref:Uncharacterized protein n=1 Tax=Apiosordaria backusii TaxID=314023 RepID=A0AA40BEL5_9PEZI|nr:hypothetical protein B0T21DRAFT_452377 [Apiosordaria backusii]